MATWKLPLLRRTLLSASPPPFSNLSSFSRHFLSFQFKRSFAQSRSLAMEMEEESMSSILTTQLNSPTPKPEWKPLCLYYTQDKCAMMDDPVHLQKFYHTCSVRLETSVATLTKFRPQEFDYFLVLDLEGKVEILELPVLLFDVKAMDVVDVFHRFVRPTKMSEKRIDEYIKGKYGKFGVDRVWHDTAIKFDDAIEQFESWLRKDREHIKLWREEEDGRLNRAAFVTCGNWDLKTKVPQQCELLGMEVPPYFNEWINLKDIFLNFYNKRAPGMLSMMSELRIRPLGSHHLGIDDTKNIVRVMHHMLDDGALLQVTAKRPHGSCRNVDFLFQNRI
ncbi:uncharacterized exonuclease domain-containing protein At3g15140-like [Andrographis paniculata]|uniref:uncharacterized exonuclease domain-containing protein At3g15140-like n=1 Tax=Andrographis paniculata TaxID=175694 RepID=UPI0021E8FDE2|nr:uncharacterized exonuclease domain-containing protein At3g15140-like [Andrographis paniculata]XP_051151905.1 uncharacterized exonuclease domain-containing protein At3g15140-like [Andrographis paniculata]